MKKLFGLLGKPAWEHKDAAVRLRAVQSATDPALLALLPELAQRDPDPAVRAAALARIDDIELLARRMRGENAASVASAARARLLELLCAAPAPAERAIAVLASLDDPDLMGAVAERAVAAPLRRAALARINRPGFLFERCLADPDPTLRLALLERIESPDALQRLVTAARKRDKALTRAARERLQALQLASGDPAELERRVDALCQACERFGRALPADAVEQLEALRADWAQLAPRVDLAQQRRAEAWLDRAALALAAARPAAAPPPATVDAQVPDEQASGDRVDGAAKAAAEAAIATDVTAPAERDAELDQLAANLPAAGDAGFEAQARQLSASARACLERHPGNPAVAAQHADFERALEARRRAHRDALDVRTAEQRGSWSAQLDALEAAIGDGNLGAAHAARQALQDAALPADLRRRLSAADAELGKLDQWQRWAGNKVRSRLCDEAEALAGSGLHPDAVATRVKELQAEWSRLDALEPVAPPEGLTRRFRALCQRAMAPTREFFDKRRQLREQRADMIAALIERVATVQTTDAAIDANAARELRRELTDALRALDEVPSERRGALGRALRDRLAAIDAALDAAREQAMLQKRRLLATLKRELGHADDEAAASLAKSAQAEWKRLPRADRKQEDALWAELRALIDPLFDRLRGREQGAREQQAAAEADARALLDELDALAAAEPERLLHADAHLEALITRWRGLTAVEPAASESRGPGERGPAERRPPSRNARDPRGNTREPRPARREHPLESRFSAAVARVQAARQAALRRRERQTMLALGEAGRLLDRLRSESSPEQHEAIASGIAALDLPADARALLQPRLAPGLLPEGAADADATEALAVRAELAAGLDSPVEATAIRRQEQMRRLASRLEGGSTAEPADEIRRRMIELQAMPGIEPARREALQQRILAAYDRITGAG